MKTRTAALSTRELLLDSALTLFAQRGYSATSIRDIISAAGVTQPTLYYHFQDKADLFRGLIEQHSEASLERLEQILAGIPGLVERLRRMMHESFRYCLADPRIPRLLFQTYFGPEVSELTPTLQRITARRFELVTRIMRDGIATGELRPADPQFLALGFCCLMDQPLNLFSRRDDPDEVLTPALADSLVQLFLHGAGGTQSE